MKKQVQTWLKNKKAIVGVGVTAVLILSGVFQHRLNTKSTNISSLQGNLSTCFSRVNQSYTAKVIGDSSSMYLESGFMKTTEECFAETSSQFEEIFSSTAKKMGQALNALVSDVHWFHERVEETTNSFSEQDSEVVLSNLSDRFEKLEMKYDEVDGEVIRKVESISLSISNMTVLLFILSILAPLLLLWDLAERKNLKQRNGLTEKSARDRLASDKAVVHSEVADIIKEALEQNKLVYCSKLFSQYHALNPVKNVEDTVGRIQTISLEAGELSENQIDDIWSQTENDDSLVMNAEGTEVSNDVYDGPVTNLDSTLTTVSTHLSNKLLAEGVVIDLNISENLFVQAEEEAIEQVVYNLIMNAVKNCQVSDASPRIQIEAKKLGDNIFVNIEDSGLGFSKDFLSAANGLGDLDDEMPLSLKISRELVEDFNGSMSFENLYEDKEISGSKVQVVLRSNGEQLKRVASITKGTKREILESMKQQSV
ncbi:hypothetical protein A9Q84_08785 [Halobacteriovorax marinus]|uniref:Histidine kinase domain-containing protein n=1 Tax=Halobacteriovorax marinus TaxID=97084 RepID=A0A1Y5F6A8_9BACT|nr:hypothetical protein A9Q84_08785 [Halobacteriovorax marinus]